MNRIIIFLIIFIVVNSCGPKLSDLPKDNNLKDETIKDNKIIIYQLLPRLFSNTKTNNKVYGTMEENGVGKFNDINDVALKALKDFGITHIWFTGVLEHATMSDFTKYGIPLDDADIVKGRAGSPYAIKDYYDVSPELAVDIKNRMKEFESLVERTHKNGLKVIIDFVPNHVARNYKSDAKPSGVKDLGADDDKTVAFSPKNNFYYIIGEKFKVPSGYNPLGDEKHPLEDGVFDENPAKATGNDQFTSSPDINSWFETVKLNYGIDYKNDKKKYFDPLPDTWIKMKDILIFWVKKGIDGFRCDMAEMVPVEFWNYAISEVKKINSNVIFIAEIYNPYAYADYIDKGKFDFLYDKVGLYDSLKELIKGRGDAGKLQYCWFQKTVRGRTSHLLRFLENHDEERIASKNFANDPFKALPAMIVTATYSSGPLMLYFGQESGEKGEGKEGFGGDDGRTTIFDYWGVPYHQKWVNYGKYDGGAFDENQKRLWSFYRDLNHFVLNNEAIRKGRLYDLTYANIEKQSKGWSDKKHLAYIRYTDNSRILTIVNFDHNNPMNVRLKIPVEVWKAMKYNEKDKYILKPLFSTFSTSEEIHFKGIDTIKRNNKNAGIKITLPPNSAVIYSIDKI